MMEKISTRLSDQFHSHKKEEPHSVHSEQSNHGNEPHRTSSRAKEAYTPGLTYNPSHPPPPANAHHPGPPVMPHHPQITSTVSCYKASPIQFPPVSGHGQRAYVPPVATHITSHQDNEMASPPPEPQKQAKKSPLPVGHPQPMISPSPGGHPKSMASPPAGAHGLPGAHQAPSNHSPYKGNPNPIPVPHSDEASKRKKSPEPKKERKRDAKDGGLDDHVELGLELIGKVLKVIG